MTWHKSNEEGETLSSYIISLMDVLRLTQINKIVLDMACEYLDLKLFTKT